MTRIEEGDDTAELAAWDDCMGELTRQVTVQMEERGRLLSLCRLKYLGRINKLEAELDRHIKRAASMSPTAAPPRVAAAAEVLPKASPKA